SLSPAPRFTDLGMQHAFVLHPGGSRSVPDPRSPSIDRKIDRRSEVTAETETATGARAAAPGICKNGTQASCRRQLRKIRGRPPGIRRVGCPGRSGIFTSSENVAISICRPAGVSRLLLGEGREGVRPAARET